MSKKDNASRRAASELFSEENETGRAKNMPDADAARREKLRREMFGDSPAAASVSARPETPKVTQNRPKNDSGKVSAIPLTKEEAMFRSQSGALRGHTTGNIPRVNTGTTGSVPRVQTGSVPRVNTGTVPRATTGSIPRVRTETIPTVTTTSIPRVRTGSVTRVQTGSFDTAKTVAVGRIAEPEESFGYEDGRTRKYSHTGEVAKPRRAKKKGVAAPFLRIAAASLCILVIVGAVLFTVIYLMKSDKEEPAEIPVDVVAGTNERSEDVVSADTDSAADERYTVKFIQYNKPEVVVNTDGGTVASLMETLGITAGNDRIVSVDVGDEIASDMEIEIKDVVYKDEEKTEEIANDTVYVDDNSAYQGVETVSTEGYPGVKTLTYKVKYVNGKEESRELVSEEITTYPVDRVIKRGTLTPPTTPHSTDGVTPTTIYTGVPTEYLYYVDVRATCYYIVGTTATGLPTGDNVMAVDPSVIPLGSECVVIGELGDYGHRIAADVGGGIKGNIIDIWLPEGTGFGWQDCRVYVLREGW
ncbi:MAG: G5 domain-containing protein [Clostridia bacterium]|nr:G5 domain-containing protein [Clostridia bacterium]